MKPLLTIAIPTLTRRKLIFDELYNEFIKQINEYGNKIEIVSICDDGEITIGQKRNNLNEMAKGKYVVQWDDDDWIHPNGIDMIMEGIKSDVDVISYNHYTDIKEWGKLQNLHKYCSLKYKPPIGKIDYENSIITCTPDQKSVIKNEIAKSVKFYNMNLNEDWTYMRDILPFLKTEFYINEFIYFYLNRSNETMDVYKRHRIDKSNKIL
jgi:glycosyltransferase involved in cell wall biosynthesis